MSLATTADQKNCGHPYTELKGAMLKVGVWLFRILYANLDIPEAIDEQSRHCLAKNIIQIFAASEASEKICRMFLERQCMIVYRWLQECRVAFKMWNDHTPIDDHNFFGQRW